MVFALPGEVGKRLKDGVNGAAQQQPVRLYQQVARHLLDELAAGTYKVGDRLPAERELAAAQGVSRPAVREAILALEVLGLVEVRIGSGAYVMRLPGDQDQPGFAISAFELMEARLLMEGEGAALAAVHITDDEVAELDRLVDLIADENAQANGKEDADFQFHMTIARATRNAAIEKVVEEFWRIRSTSPECALLLDKARVANVRPVVEEHRAVVDALRKKDAGGARAAMRGHLSAVIDHLLFAIEEKAMEEARKSIAAKRRRYARPTKD